MTDQTFVDMRPSEPLPGADQPRRRPIRQVFGLSDRLFFTLIGTAAVLVLIIVVGIGVFLSHGAWSALRVDGWSFLTTQRWNAGGLDSGIAGVLPGTIVIALVALVTSFPIGLGAALFISEIAHGLLKRVFVFAIDLMSAVPSGVYGIFGLKFFEAHAVGVAAWIATWFGWIPFLSVPAFDPSNPLASRTLVSASSFIAGLVVAMMMIPIQCSIMREAFSQAPAGEREGAYALGSTRWGMIRTVVIPFGRGGIVGGTMLSLGRALGETIAVLLIISPDPRGFNWHILHSGGYSVASLIANLYQETEPFGVSALMAAGLSLFALTLLVNFAAASIMARSRSGAISD